MCADASGRSPDRELDEVLALAPAVAIDGPKGIGKTDTARRRADEVWYLDDPAQREIARADFQFTGAPAGCLLLDESQRLPQIWDSVRRAVDAGVPAGRFLLTGSATPQSGSGTHSGAGRILSLRMRPMALHERGRTEPTVLLSDLLAGTAGHIHDTSPFTLVDYTQAIVESGFPAIMQAPERLRRSISWPLRPLRLGCWGLMRPRCGMDVGHTWSGRCSSRLWRSGCGYWRRRLRRA